MADYRLEKLKNLNAMIRSIIIQKTPALREGKPDNFRSYKKEMEDAKELQLMWSEKVKSNREKGSDEKQETEEKRLEMLDFLRLTGAPSLTPVKWTNIWQGRSGGKGESEDDGVGDGVCDGQLHHPPKAPSSLQDPNCCTRYREEKAENCC